LNAAQAPDGTMSAARIDAVTGSTDSYLNSFVATPSLYAGETMSGSVWLRSVSGTQNVNLYIVDNFPGGYGLPAWRQVQLTTTWQQFQLSGDIANNVTSLKLQIGGGGSVTGGQSFLIWNPLLEDVGTTGTSVTNFAPYSQRFSSWTNSQGSAVDNSAVAPDGTNTASTLIANAGATDNFVVSVIANPAPFSGVAVTGSVWLRVPSGNPQVLLTFYETNSNGAYVTGAQTITLSSTWQRFQVSGTTQSMLNYLDFQIGGANSFTNGQVIYAWGAQVELAAQAGPYVATGGTVATKGTSLTNLLPNSQRLSASSWTVGGGTQMPYGFPAPDGSMTATQVTGTSGDVTLWDSVINPVLYDGAVVTGSVYLRSLTGTQNINLYLAYVDAGGVHYLTQAVSLSTVWRRFQLSETIGTGLTQLALQIGGGGSVGFGQGFAMWGPQMEIGSHAGTYVATTALPVVSGSQPTNILPNSQATNGPSWVDSNGTVTVNSDTAPDGTQTASTFSSTGPTAWILGNVANPSLYDQQTVTASVYLRSPSGTMPFNIALIQTGDNGWTYFMGGCTLTTSWQRCQVSGTMPNGLTSLGFQIAANQGLASGQSVEIWGPQVVIGSVNAPYTPTLTTTTVYATGQPGTLVPYGLNEAYAYDSFGNILQNGPSNAFYTANNQMFGYAYDAAGNLLSNGVTPLTWDAESRLTSAAGATYIYDAEGNRVEKQGVGVTDTVYFGGKPIARLAAGQWTDLIYGPNGMLAEVAGTQTAQPTYRLLDHLGTEIGQTDASAQLINPLDYRPFGGVFSGNTNDPYLFTGKERDAESGLDYFGARYYGSNMGRWMSPDWSAKASAVPYAKLDNPQSLNLYGYVGNNPLSARDIDGHHQVCAPDTTTVDKDGNTTVHAGACHEVSDGIIGAIGGIFSAFNPWGKLGGPAHRATVNRLAKMLEKDGFEVTRELKIDTPNGTKLTRFLDLLGYKKSTGEVKMYQVGNENKDGSPVSREVKALDDIEGATEMRPQFVGKDFASQVENLEALPVPVSEGIPNSEPVEPVEIP
jgi:RHS repeat-associated protein